MSINNRDPGRCTPAFPPLDEQTGQSFRLTPKGPIKVRATAIGGGETPPDLALLARIRGRARSQRLPPACQVYALAAPTDPPRASGVGTTSIARAERRRGAAARVAPNDAGNETGHRRRDRCPACRLTSVMAAGSRARWPGPVTPLLPTASVTEAGRASCDASTSQGHGDALVIRFVLTGNDRLPERADRRARHRVDLVARFT